MNNIIKRITDKIIDLFKEDIYITSQNDAGFNWQIGFQDPASSVMEGIISLHHEIFFFLIVILLLVS